MTDLEHRPTKLAGSWPDAAKEAEKLAALSTGYQQAVQAQATLEESIRSSVIDRGSVKAKLVTMFYQIACPAQIRFPRNRRMQYLFVDRVRSAE